MQVKTKINFECEASRRSKLAVLKDLNQNEKTIELEILIIYENE